MSRTRRRDDEDDEEETTYGIRRSRRSSSYHNRDSSALFPSQMMEQEVHYAASEDALSSSIHAVLISVLLLIIYKKMSAMTNRWQRTGLATASISAVKAGMRQIKATIERLLFLSSWIRSYGGLAFLYAEDLSVFIQRRHRFQPNRYRLIDEICRSDSNLWFSVNPHDLRRIYRAWRIPETCMGDSRQTYTGEECFLIFLYHLTKGTPFTEMARHIFGGDPRRFSPMFEAVINHLYLTFYNKISGTSLEQWIPRYIDQCRELIYNALSARVIAETHYVDGEVVDETWILYHFDFASFCIFGFLDDFAMPTARPGN